MEEEEIHLEKKKSLGMQLKNKSVVYQLCFLFWNK